MQRFPLLTYSRQSTEYSCGAAALQAVLSRWGKDLGEKELMDLLHTSPDTGTYVGDIVRVARMAGLSARLQENVSLDELREALGKGESVIVCGQAWRSREDSDRSVQEDWEDGHYIVILGMDAKYVYYQDPFIRRGKAFITHRKFDEAWHNVRGKTEGDTKKQVHLGVFISGREPPRHNPLADRDISETDLSKFGPLHMGVVRFDGALMPYDLMKPVNDLLDRRIIRPIAYFVMTRDPDGSIGVIEGGDLEEEEAGEIDAILAYLVGLGAGGTRTAEASAAIAERQTADHTFGISERELEQIAGDLPPGSSMVLLVLEHVWAKKIREIFSSQGGTIVFQGLITAGMLVRWGERLGGQPGPARGDEQDSSTGGLFHKIPGPD